MHFFVPFLELVIHYLQTCLQLLLELFNDLLRIDIFLFCLDVIWFYLVCAEIIGFDTNFGLIFSSAWIRGFGRHCLLKLWLNAVRFYGLRCVIFFFD